MTPPSPHNRTLDCEESMSRFLLEVAELNSLRSIEGEFYCTTPYLVSSVDLVG